MNNHPPLRSTIDDRQWTYTIIIPAYNESQRIAPVIAALHAAGYRDIVVVDDCSADETFAVARAAGAVVLRHPINRGQGAALQTGMDYALAYGADIIVHFDADGQMDAADIPAMTKPIIDGAADIVFGSRFLDGRTAVPWAKKWCILKPAIMFNCLMTGIWLSDAHNGFRALSREAARQCRIRHDRMAHATEIVAQTHALGIRYTEVPVRITYSEFGQGFIGGLKIVRDLFMSTIFR